VYVSNKYLKTINEKRIAVQIQDGLLKHDAMSCDVGIPIFQRNHLPLSSIFNPKNRGSIFLQTNDTCLPHYTAPYP
jgi:hypothetical protein